MDNDTIIDLLLCVSLLILAYFISSVTGGYMTVMTLKSQCVRRAMLAASALLLSPIVVLAQWVPQVPTTTVTSTSTTTTLSPFTPTVSRNGSKVSVSVGPKISVTDMEKKLADGSLVVKTLMSFGLFDRISTVSKVDSSEEKRNDGCEVSGHRQFLYVEPNSRLKDLDPFLVEVKTVKISPNMAKMCFEDSVVVSVEGPQKYYKQFQTPDKKKSPVNFFGFMFKHTAFDSTLAFGITNESYASLLKKLQLSGVLAADVAITNSVVLTAAEMSLKDVLVKINEGAL